mmetsp:Transcript_15912/g.29430  ORF Transcript_15912/g.29430 Transcript_15912/m.29430 type:complete len:239 (-) Transcript_15912:452-1168(-)
MARVREFDLGPGRVLAAGFLPDGALWAQPHRLQHASAGFVRHSHRAGARHLPGHAALPTRRGGGCLVRGVDGPHEDRGGGVGGSLHDSRRALGEHGDFVGRDEERHRAPLCAHVRVKHPDGDRLGSVLLLPRGGHELRRPLGWLAHRVRGRHRGAERPRGGFLGDVGVAPSCGADLRGAGGVLSVVGHHPLAACAPQLGGRHQLRRRHAAVLLEGVGVQGLCVGAAGQRGSRLLGHRS